MGKSAKKSATKVDAVAPVVAVAPTKPLKKGKRDAEEVIEKKTNGKKQKKDIVEAIEKKKVEKKVVKKVSSSDDSSDESDDEPEVKVPAKKAPAPKDSSSEEESSSDDEPAVPAKKLPAKNGNAKKASSSSDESESESESDEDKAPVTKKVAAKKTESSDESDEESSEDEKVTKNGTVKKAESSEEDSSEEESSDEEDATPAKKAAPVTAKKDESSSDDEDESSDDEMVDAEETKKQEPKTPTPKVQATEGGSKTLFVGNIAYSVEKSDVEAFFKDAGEVVDIRFATHPDGSFKGYGHVEFSTAEEAKKALELNGELLCGRDVRLDLANERGAYTPQTGGNERGSFQKAQSQTVFVKGFDVSEGEDQIRSALEEHFGSCGEITRVGIPTEADGTSKGIAYVDFKDAEGFNKALELNHSSLGNASLYVQEAKPRDSSGGGGRRGGRGDSGGRGFGGGGRRGGRGDSGGRFGGGGRRGGRGDSGGRFGGGGGRRGGFNKPSMTPTGKKTTFE